MNHDPNAAFTTGQSRRAFLEQVARVTTGRSHGRACAIDRAGSGANASTGAYGPDRTLEFVVLGGTMKFRSILCPAAGVMLLGLWLAGCSAPTANTGPTEEPNVGPGVPAGGPPAAVKAPAKGDSAGPASTKDATKK